MTGRVISLNASATTGVGKDPVDRAELVSGHGLAGDAHAGEWHRQVSLLAYESIEKMVALGLDVGPGDFAENITTMGVDLVALPVGSVLEVGEAVVEISQIGKECHTRCAIYDAAGDCVMPREGVFAIVRTGGDVRPGDPVRVVSMAGGEDAADAGADEEA